MRIAVAGTGYVGLSLAVLLSQKNMVTAVDVVESKVQMINDWKSPIQDEYIEKFLTEHRERELNIHATLDGASAYASADFVIIAAPTNYDPQKNFFDTSAVESVIELVLKSSQKNNTCWIYRKHQEKVRYEQNIVLSRVFTRVQGSV